MSKGRTKMKMVSRVEIVTLRELERTEKHTMIYGEMIKDYLEELHPKLPAYFCNSGSYVWPLCIDGDIDKFLETNRAKRIDEEGQVDRDVLVAIHNIIKNDKYRKLKKDDILYLVDALKAELGDPNSELSQALAQAYGSS